MAYDDLPWDEPVEHETSITYTYFASFRDAGVTRSFYDTAKQHGLSLKYVQKLSHRHSWTQRALAYDVYMDGKRREVNEAAILQMNARQADLGRLMQDKARIVLERQDPSAMTPHELARYIEAGAKLERVARGEPETRTSTEVKGDGPTWADVRRSILNTRVDKGDKEPLGPTFEGEGDPWGGWKLPDIPAKASSTVQSRRHDLDSGGELNNGTSTVSNLNGTPSTVSDLDGGTNREPITGTASAVV